MDKHEKYVPALGYNFLTPLYDPLVRWLMPESEIKSRLVGQARIQAGWRVLDLGCGTATLTVMLKRAHPQAEVSGLDGDPRILEIARRKAARAGVEVVFREGMAYALPYAGESFERVLTSMVLHHLTTDNRRRALAEVLRVLTRGGELHVADFHRPNKLLPALMRETGFAGVEECDRYRTLFGALTLWRARKD